MSARVTRPRFLGDQRCCRLIILQVQIIKVESGIVAAHAKRLSDRWIQQPIDGLIRALTECIPQRKLDAASRFTDAALRRDQLVERRADQRLRLFRFHAAEAKSARSVLEAQPREWLTDRLTVCGQA